MRDACVGLRRLRLQGRRIASPCCNRVACRKRARQCLAPYKLCEWPTREAALLALLIHVSGLSHLRPGIGRFLLWNAMERVLVDLFGGSIPLLLFVALLTIFRPLGSLTPSLGV